MAGGYCADARTAEGFTSAIFGVWFFTVKPGSLYRRFSLREAANACG
jgi:hypothetical protein